MLIVSSGCCRNVFGAIVQGDGLAHISLTGDSENNFAIRFLSTLMENAKLSSVARLSNDIIDVCRWCRTGRSGKPCVIPASPIVNTLIEDGSTGFAVGRSPTHRDGIARINRNISKSAIAIG